MPVSILLQGKRNPFDMRTVPSNTRSVLLMKQPVKLSILLIRRILSIEVVLMVMQLRTIKIDFRSMQVDITE